MDQSDSTAREVVKRLLQTVKTDLIPLASRAVMEGNKVFGAAVLKLSDLSLVVAGTNMEVECPLWHGEVACINKFWALPEGQRPKPSECLMLATHEPCSMCISVITWSGFAEVHFFFSMEDSRDSFNIPHDLRIYKEVFSCERATRENAFWKAFYIPQVINDMKDSDDLKDKAREIREMYASLSETYQRSKQDARGRIPLA